MKLLLKRLKGKKALLVFILFLLTSLWHLPLTAQTTRTVGTGGNYTTLKGAFDAINAGSISGTIILQVISSTTETASAVLNASGMGSANYTSITIYPTGSSYTISGNLNTSLISFDGADNVTIDGRVNRTGSTPNLTITNISTGTNAANCAIRFINSASNNTLQYCHLRASGTATSGSAVLFSTATAGNGNDNNIIEYCQLTNAGGNRPSNLIYSSGTSARENSGNIIRYNSLFDSFRAEATSHGIYITSNSFDCTVIGKKFYETTSFSPSGSNRMFYPIRINNTSGNGFIITDNFIGGRQSECGGAAWTVSASVNHRLYAIHLVVGTGTNSVQNNIIRNFNYSSTHINAWFGIFISSGNANIGTETGNTIGATAGNGSITLTNSSANATSYGIYISSTGTVSANNNNIGAITTIGASSLSHSFTAIIKTAVAGTTILNNNLIGSASTSNSIHASSSSTSSTAQQVYGIQSTGTGSVTISGNTIANMHNAYAPASSSSGQVVGILTSGAGIYTIQNNTIRNLTTTSPNTSTTTAASAIGISAATTGVGKIVSGNTIYNLSNTASTAAVSVLGIYYAGATTGTNLVYNNFIHSLSLSSSSASAIIAGIRIGSGTTTYYNNIISIGSGVNNACIIYGIYETGASGNNNFLYFNTIYIGGQPAGNVNTYALYNNTNTNIRNFRNNIFFNNRSNISGTAKHYAIRLAGITNLTINYNDYYAPGTGGVLGYLTSDRTTLTAWRTATSQDVNSVNTNPLLQNIGGTNPNDYKPDAVLVGVFISGFDEDYNGGSRPPTPSMGALEIYFFMSETETYTAGNINTDYSFQSLPGSSNCPGFLTVQIPPGAVIVGVAVEYQITAWNNGWMSEQRSQLRCVSAGGTSESVLAQGVGVTEGTYSYSRSNLTIANGVTSGGNIDFELHAGRTWGGSGCNATYNYVNNNTWKVTVTYYTTGIYADFEANKTTAQINETITFTDLSGGGTINSWYWDFGSGAVPATANTLGPHDVIYSTAGSKTISLTVNGTKTEIKTNYIAIIPPGDWLKWDDGINASAVGLTAAGVFQIAVRFEPNDITPYYSHELTHIRLYIRDLPNNAIIKIWQGTNQANLSEVYSQSFTSVANSWVEIALNTPYEMDAELELWFGAQIDDPGDGYFPAGKDAATSQDGKSNMIRMDINDNAAWVPLSNFSIVGDWNLQAYLIPVGIWTGNTSTEWTVEGNWSSFILPGTNSRVTIPNTAHDPVIDTDVTINKIKIQSNASLTINHQASLTLSGSIENNAGASGLIIASNINGTGSLIHNTNNVPATFKRYISGDAEAWHLLSSPLAAQEIAGDFIPSGTYGDGTGYDFFYWHEPDTSWIYFNHPAVWSATHGNNYFGVARAYLVAYQQLNPTKSFEGNLNNGPASIAITKTTGTGLNFGANLVGNPYPSSIDWKAPSGWSRNDLLVTGGGYDIWIWNDTAYNYGVYNSASSVDEGTLGVTRFIAPTQGFFVQAQQNGSLSMNNDVRANQGAGNWIKNLSHLPFALHLTVQSNNGNGTDEVMVEFGQTEKRGGTEKKFSFVKHAPSLFIREKTSNYSWAYYENPENYPVIPLSFKAGVKGSYTLNASFDPNYFEMILLLDQKANLIHDLKSTPVYHFLADEKDHPGRFVLQFAPGVFGNPHQKLPANIFTFKDIIYIDLRLLYGTYTFDLFDITGRKINDATLAGGQIFELPLMQKGIFIGRIVGKEGIYSKKILH